MKMMVWLVFLGLASLWTGFMAIAAKFTQALLTAIPPGQGSDFASTVGQWPVPAGLALWVDPAWLQGMQAAVVELVQWLGHLLPTATGLMGWITPLLWIGWLLGMLILLVPAVVGHWLIGRLGSPAKLNRAIDGIRADDSPPTTMAERSRL